MFLECLLFLLVWDQIDARLQLESGGLRPCPYPRFDHGRWRMRQKSKLIKYMCFPGYELVGNKYATCRDGHWDVPMPVCVKPGCLLDQTPNGIQLPSRGGAWVVFFCLPGHKLVGSNAIYCDGRKWNGTAPSCVDSTIPEKLDCDFESSDLCGWTQDDLHDFDWKRLNRATPSSFLNTGPSFDHTLGDGGSGYYMYIESTSRMVNDTARLISPVYADKLVHNACFSFYYHMFGKSTGGLKVYQKPEKYPLENLLQLPDVEIQKYILFEKWGNQGNVWYRGVADLVDFSDSFQIVIEGIRGSSYTSDIAIDDVSILFGENCTLAKQSIVAAAAPSKPNSFFSCSGRCFEKRPDEMCGCTSACLNESTCCQDFFDTCVFDISDRFTDMSASESASDESIDLPQTEKLVASTTVTIKTTSKPPTTARPITVKEPTIGSINTSWSTITSTSTTIKPYTRPPRTLAPKLTFFFMSTTRSYSSTGSLRKGTSKVNRTTEKVNVTTPKLVTTTPRPTTKAVTTTPVPFKATTVQKIISTIKRSDIKVSTTEIHQSNSSSLKTGMITITALLCLAAVVWFIVISRGPKGRAVIARLRGRACGDSEVRYLNRENDFDE